VTNTVLSVITDQLFDMLIGSLDNPPWVFFRATLMAYFDCTEPRCIDLCLVLGTELVPILWAGIHLLLQGLDVFVLADRYMEGACFWMILIACFRICLRMLAWRMPHKQQLKTLKVADKLRESYLGAEVTCPLFEQPASDSDEDDEEDESTHRSGTTDSSRDEDSVEGGVTDREIEVSRVGLLSTSNRLMGIFPQRQKNMILFVVFFVMHLVVLLIVAMAHALSRSIPSLMFCLGGVALSMILVSMALQRLAPGFLGVMYQVLVGLFVAFALGLLLMSMSYNGDAREEAHNARMFFDTPQGQMRYQWLPAARYPMCLMRWGAPGVPEELHLTVLDLMTFSSAIYGRDWKEIMCTVGNSTKGTHLQNIELDYLEDTKTVGRWGVFKLPDAKLRVIAIRGTQTLHDALADLDLFAVVQTLQIMDSVMPVLSVFSLPVIQKVVQGVGVDSHFKLAAEAVWHPVVNASMYWRKRSEAENYTTVVVGHSLGGMLAAVVGAKCQVPALALSPPGQLYSLMKLGITRKELEQTLSVVQPLHDVVPKVDRQPGMVQHIACNGGYLQCHLQGFTSCEIFRKCGDARGRSMNHTCRGVPPA